MTHYNEISLLKTIANSCYSFIDEVYLYDFIFQSSYLDLNKYDISMPQENDFKYFNFNYYYLVRIWSHLHMQLTFPKIRIISKLNWNTLWRIFANVSVSILYGEEVEQKIWLKLVYLIGMEMIYRDFNILRVIKAMHDIERIKELLLTQDQLKLFNHLPKPSVLIKRT